MIVHQRRKNLEQMKAGHTPKNLRNFIVRFEHDNAREMEPEQWDKWVDALPIPEFMAMCFMTQKERPNLASAMGLFGASCRKEDGTMSSDVNTSKEAVTTSKEELKNEKRMG